MMRSATLASGILEVERDRPLVPVQRQERNAFAVDPNVGHAPVPHPVALDRLDLDHVCAEVSEDLCGKWSLRQLGEVGNWRPSSGPPMM